MLLLACLCVALVVSGQHVLSQAFELQVARGGVWSRAISVAGKILKRNRYQGLSIAGSTWRKQAARVMQEEARRGTFNKISYVALLQ